MAPCLRCFGIKFVVVIEDGVPRVTGVKCSCA